MMNKVQSIAVLSCSLLFAAASHAQTTKAADTPPANMASSAASSSSIDPSTGTKKNTYPAQAGQVNNRDPNASTDTTGKKRKVVKHRSNTSTDPAASSASMPASSN
ncbi:hypothetical protein ACO0LO_12395 [Undibacterium sp. TJN25]|uniref:hypothetical protein n=1 Tax=Undibacterium sp. TJN25 TaxID=3413056 RepID=UPI003BEFCC14